MIDRQAFILAARAYVGTPFHLKGRLKGVGIDCNGLLICALRDAGWADVPDPMEYKHPPDPNYLLDGLKLYADPLPPADAAPGDALVFWITKRDRPQHFGLATDLGMIHVAWGDSLSRAVEHRVPLFWAKRLFGVYRVRNMTPPAAGQKVAWPNERDEQESRAEARAARKVSAVQAAPAAPGVKPCECGQEGAGA